MGGQHATGVPICVAFTFYFKRKTMADLKFISYKLGVHTVLVNFENIESNKITSGFLHIRGTLQKIIRLRVWKPLKVY